MRLALNPCVVFGRVEACRPCTVLWGAPFAEARGGGLSTRSSWRPLSGQKAQPRVSCQEPRCTRGSPLTATATGHPGLAHWTRAQAGAGGGGPQRGAAEWPPCCCHGVRPRERQGKGGEGSQPTADPDRLLELGFTSEFPVPAGMWTASGERRSVSAPHLLPASAGSPFSPASPAPHPTQALRPTHGDSASKVSPSGCGG